MKSSTFANLSTSDLVEQMRAAYIAAHVAGRTAALVYWDERVMMPSATSSFRVRQRSWTSGRAHELLQDPDLRDAAMRVCEREPEHAEALAVLRAVQRAALRPVSWVERQAAATAAARHAWIDARRTGRVDTYLGALAEVVDLAREEASIVGYETEPYDALLGTWEPGMHASTVVELIEDVVDTASDLRSRAYRAERSVLEHPVPASAVWELERAVVEALGFDLSAGRIDPSSRAFCIVLGPGDVRIASRCRATPGIASLTSTMHEVGHGIYAQAMHRLGLPLPCAEAPGVAIDESQSRLIENHVGLHPGFLEWIRQQAIECIGPPYDRIDPAAWVQAWHGRAGSTLRVGADELDYDAHILIRTRLERALINGDLEVAELPGAWSDQSRRLLPHLSTTGEAGILQDIHWSIGQFGYFPCYTLGNIWSAQIMHAARCSISDLDKQLSSANTTHLRAWLDEGVYVHGCMRSAPDIMQAIVGTTDSGPMKQHLAERFGVGSRSSAL